MNTKTVWLQEMKWPEVKEHLAASKRIILPVGSTEQHGSWLPLGSDTLVAITLAEEAARQAGVLVAPPLWFGWSPHHMAMPGTITIRAEILGEILYDEISSLARHGFESFVVLNGHRLVNIPWMQIAAERAQRQLGVKVVIFDPAYMSKEIVDRLGCGPAGHAEEIEGSHMLYRYPDLVDQSQARDYVPENHGLYRVDPRDPHDTLCYVPGTEEAVREIGAVSGGCVGSPTRASRDTGKIYHEHLVSRLVQVLQKLEGTT